VAEVAAAKLACGIRMVDNADDRTAFTYFGLCGIGLFAGTSVTGFILGSRKS
jgi:hypothetical protein